MSWKPTEVFHTEFESKAEPELLTTQADNSATSLTRGRETPGASVVRHNVLFENLCFENLHFSAETYCSKVARHEY